MVHIRLAQIQIISWMHIRHRDQQRVAKIYGQLVRALGDASYSVDSRAV